MITVGAYVYVCSETRYLPLVLEQLSFFPRDRTVVLWMDEPFFWLSDQPKPSGWASNVGAILNKFPHTHVVRLSSAEGNNAAENFCSHALAAAGVDVTFIFSTDHLINLPDLPGMIREIENAPEPRAYNIAARHYWRDWGHVYADSNMLIARPTAIDVFLPDDTKFHTLPGMCYHPSWVLSDEEAHRKSHSWGHADIFTSRNFYENEWIGRNDANWKARPADVSPPGLLMERLKHWGAIL
jgi:hypothetical protein